MNNCKKECPLLSVSLIKLTQGKYAIVDNDIYSELSNHRWCATKKVDGYRAIRNVKRNGRRLVVYMHREIMNLCRGDRMVVDHKNHNPLDNRKQNLRTCTQSQNLRNQTPRRFCTSKFKGVWWNGGVKKWVAGICLSGKNKHLGVYADETDAARAYNSAAIKNFGEFACINNEV